MTGTPAIPSGRASMTPAPGNAALAEPKSAPPFAPRRMLVATDGRSRSDGTLRLALAIADRHRSSVDQVTVFEPRVPIPGASTGCSAVLCEHTDEPALVSLAARVRAQRHRVLDDAPDWPIHVSVGYPSVVIEQFARRARADLIVTGLGPVLPDERKFSKETPLAVAFTSDVPVLAVAPDAYRLPQRVMVVLEYDVASVRAASVAMELVAPGGVVHLVYVRRGAPPWTLESSWALDRLYGAAEHDAEGKGVTLERLVVDGDPIPAILAAAEHVGTELIATALHGTTLAQRNVIANLAAPLLRGARCSVLVVPGERIEH